jgi:replicative DNA helicase
MSDPAVLPSMNIDAELAVLGSIMIGASECLPQIRRILTPAHFFLETHRMIYQSMLDSWDTYNGAVDYVLVTDKLSQRQQLETCGGWPYLIGLLNAVPTYIHGVYYAKVVKEHALRRRALSEAGRMAQRAYAP